MKQDLWAPHRRIESQYLKALREITKYLQDNIQDETDPLAIASKLKFMLRTSAFNKYAEATATKMITNLFTDGGKTWREAAHKNSKGRVIYEALRKELNGPIGRRVAEEILKNAEIIKTLPLDISSGVTRYIADETFKGRRASDIAKEIKLRFPASSDAKARLIARTEVAKAQTALTQARAENLGIVWYVWRTSSDSRVRDSHELMNGVLCRWNEPPSPETLDGKKTYGKYQPGGIFNCRCYPEPLVYLDQVQWPHKVYHNGAITMMTRIGFEKLAA